MLGSLTVLRDGNEVAVRGAMVRALLAVLVLHPNEPVSTERLAIALWGEDAPKASVRTVQVYVSRLRRALGRAEILVTSAAGYLLCAGADDIDAMRFERGYKSGLEFLRAGDAARAGTHLRDALGLWRGPALAEFAGAPFAAAEIARLEELRLAALEARVDADLTAGRHGELVGELERRIAEHPLRERPYGQLMLALYRGGRQADALAVFRRARTALLDGLAVEPGSELRRLERAILEHDPALQVPAIAVRSSEPNLRTARVPLPPTRTVGREDDLDRALKVLTGPSVRLVTIVGAGGVGKTRLAIEVAHAVASAFGEGADFVSLASVNGDEDVAGAIVHELGITVLSSESPAAAVIRHLERRERLLVLDNFEHVLAAAPLVAELVAAHRALKILVTSREPLHLRAERVFRLDPLDRAPAVELFAAVAGSRDHGFDVGEHNAPAVADVCRRLDGLPLAIELAASRVGVLSVQELQTRLQSGLGALGTAERDAPARQRTLLATLEWSFGLASAAEQSALAALAVFAGGAALDAVEAVTAASVDTVEALVAKNLVVAQRTAEGLTRFTLLEVVRAFALDQLARRPDADAVRRRHCEFYAAFVEGPAAEIELTSSSAALARIELEIANLRSALAWAVDHDASALALRLVCALRSYWHLRKLDQEACRWFRAALDLPDDGVPVSLRATALEYFAFPLAEGHAVAAAEAAARQSLGLRRSIGDPAGCAASLCALGYVRMSVHDVNEAYRYAAEAESLAEQAGDERQRIEAIHLKAMMAPSLAEALELGAEATAAHRTAGNLRRAALLMGSLAYTALFHDAPDVAERLARESLDVARIIGNPAAVAMAEGNAGLAALLSGDAVGGRDMFLRQLRHAERDRLDALVFEAFNGLAAVAAEAGDDELSANLAGAADASSTSRHDPVITERLDRRFFAPSRRRLGTRAWTSAHQAGAELDPLQALDLARRGPHFVAVVGR